MNSVIRSEIYALRNNARIAYVGSVSEEGFPQIKGMLVLEHAGMQTHYFSTTDHETKASLWRDGFEIYYPKGVDDEDYCVYQFTAETVNYYHGLSNVTAPIDEL